MQNSGQAVGSVELAMRWAVWPQISGDSTDTRGSMPTPFEVTFEVKPANVYCFIRCLIHPLYGFAQGAGPLGIDLIFPFVKSVTPGGMADLLGVRPSLVITHIEDEPMENRNSEEALRSYGRLAALYECVFVKYLRHGVPCQWYQSRTVQIRPHLQLDSWKLLLRRQNNHVHLII